MRMQGYHFQESLLAGWRVPQPLVGWLALLEGVILQGKPVAGVGVTE